MRIKVVLFLALLLLSGLLFVALRKPARFTGPQTVPPTQAGTPPAAPDVVARDRGAVASTKSSRVASLSPEALWAKPVTEPQFAAFKEWTERYRKTGTSEAKAAMEGEGVTLARARLSAMADLIQSNPERALALTVPDDVRNDLPPAVGAL